MHHMCTYMTKQYARSLRNIENIIIIIIETKTALYIIYTCIGIYLKKLYCARKKSVSYLRRTSLMDIPACTMKPSIIIIPFIISIVCFFFFYSKTRLFSHNACAVAIYTICSEKIARNGWARCSHTRTGRLPAETA